ncbi:hypothetical protein BC835DRAFT_437099 [Cytidiella melzeri]|nr:hypothetical protein BC835DRAFT_437099 [Cytidiella melzeri]
MSSTSQVCPQRQRRSGLFSNLLACCISVCLQVLIKDRVPRAQVTHTANMQHLYQSNSPSQTSYAHGSVSRQRQNQTRTSQGVVTEIHARSIVATSIQPRANYARFSESAVSNESSSYHASNFNTLAAQDYAPHRPSDHENSLFGTRSPQELPHTSSLNAENVVPSDSGNVSNYFALGRPWDISTSHAAGLNVSTYIERSCAPDGHHVPSNTVI